MATVSMERTLFRASDGKRKFGRASLPITIEATALRLTSALAGLVRRCGERLADDYRVRRDTRRLEQLDDRMLRDIGLNRSEIASAVRGAAAGEAVRRIREHSVGGGVIYRTAARETRPYQ